MPRKRVTRKKAAIIGRHIGFRVEPETANADRRRAIIEALADLGQVIYAIRCPDGLIKIGWTSALRNRRRHFASDFDAILAVIPGTYDDEQALHTRFRPHCAKGREYYHPTPEILGFINDIRERAGIPPIPAE